MKTKVCIRCKQELILDNFYINKDGKVNSYCKTCDKERKKDTKPIEPPTDLNFYKTCSCCGQKKLATEFNKHKRRKDGLSTQCKECDHIQQKQYAEKYKNNTIPKTKLCNECGIEKLASEFDFSARSFDRLSYRCKACSRKATAEYKNFVLTNRQPIPENYTKICAICKVNKPANAFYKSSYNWDGLQYTCKVCEKREERRIYNRNYGKQIITKKCKICGAEYQAARSSSDRCENCKQHTIPEEIFIQILKKHNIQYETEYRVNKLDIWCDFYLPKYKIFIDINPTATHSTINEKEVFESKPENYHINRRKQIIEEGYIYISIWDWDKPEDIILALINKTLEIKTTDEPNVYWCRNNLSSIKWGSYNKTDILDLTDREDSVKITENYAKIYDDGQTLIY